MKNQKFTLLIMLALSFVMAGQVMAAIATDGSGVQRLWTSLDSNVDGFLSEQESGASVSVIDNWDEIDADKDNKVGEEGFIAFFTKI